MSRVGILSTHPIQYQVPWYRALNRTPEIDLRVFFCLLPDAAQQGAGFGVSFQWDVPLLDGYRYRVLRNAARRPHPSRFFGCHTPEIGRIVRDGGFDAFIVNGWHVRGSVQALLACRRYRVPCIVRGESNELRPRPRWKRLGHRLLMTQYSACLYVGEANRRFYLRNGVAAGKLFFAPYCVDNEWFGVESARRRADRPAIRANWGIGADAFVFLFAGKLIPKKRPLDLLRAAAIGRRNPDGRRRLHLLIVGNGGLRSECERFARRRDLPVTFAGFLNQTEMPRAYAAADCLVLPSDHGETWGLVVNEAMACGLPAIVSDRVGCHPDLVAAGRTGDVFRCGDVAALAETMGRLAADPARAREMGAEARRLVVDSYSVERLVRGTIAALEYVRGRD